MADLDSATHCERDDSPENCGIEITEEMIEAGVAAYIRGDPRFDSEGHIVETIFREMASLAPWLSLVCRLPPKPQENKQA